MTQQQILSRGGFPGRVGSLAFFAVCYWYSLLPGSVVGLMSAMQQGFPVSCLEEAEEEAVWRGDCNSEDNESGREPDEATGNEMYLAKPTVPFGDKLFLLLVLEQSH